MRNRAGITAPVVVKSLLHTLFLYRVRVGTAAAAGQISGDSGTLNKIGDGMGFDKKIRLIFCDIQTENLFHTYSQYASMTKLPPQPSDEENRNQAQIKDLLEKVHPAIICASDTVAISD